MSIVIAPVPFSFNETCGEEHILCVDNIEVLSLLKTLLHSGRPAWVITPEWVPKQ